MRTSQYRYLVEVQRLDGTPLAQAAINPDWEPLIESAWGKALRQGIQHPLAALHTAALEPLWLDAASLPHLRGMRVTLQGANSSSTHDFSLAFFKHFAAAVASELVEADKLSPGERYTYLVSAYAAQMPAPDESASLFEWEDTTPALELRTGSLAEFQQAATPPEEQSVSDDWPVFIPKQTLDEIAQLTQAAAACETGGLLIGYVHQDQASQEPFLEVTCQLPAHHTQAELTKLTFTAETWTQAQTALTLRRRDEIYLGWWHSHPVRHWRCKDCPPERQRVCHLAQDFLSAHDRALHRTVFPRAYSLALVANDVPFSEITFSLFGWRDGLIAPRHFQVLTQPINTRQEKANYARERD